MFGELQKSGGMGERQNWVSASALCAGNRRLPWGGRVNGIYYDRKTQPCCFLHARWLLRVPRWAAKGFKTWTGPAKHRLVAKAMGTPSGQLLVNEGGQLGLAQGADFGGRQLAVLEQHQGG